MRVRLHAVELASRANGPGLRSVVWFQGCTLGCSGCFNPGTHDSGGGYDTEVESLAEQLLSAPNIEGISISGGEPFQQPDALADLVARLGRRLSPSWSSVDTRSPTFATCPEAPRFWPISMCLSPGRTCNPVI